jgi:hypothetical protein
VDGAGALALDALDESFDRPELSAEPEVVDLLE